MEILKSAVLVAVVTILSMGYAFAQARKIRQRAAKYHMKIACPKE